jgi:hypothetical protein
MFSNAISFNIEVFLPLFERILGRDASRCEDSCLECVHVCFCEVPSVRDDDAEAPENDAEAADNEAEAPDDDAEAVDDDAEPPGDATEAANSDAEARDDEWEALESDAGAADNEAEAPDDNAGAADNDVEGSEDGEQDVALDGDHNDSEQNGAKSEKEAWAGEQRDENQGDIRPVFEFEEEDDSEMPALGQWSRHEEPRKEFNMVIQSDPYRTDDGSDENFETLGDHNEEEELAKPQAQPESAEDCDDDFT